MININENDLTIKKKILFSLIILIVVLLISEIILRVIYFQVKSDEIFAIETGYHKINDYFLRERAKDAVNKLVFNFSKAQKLLFSDEGNEVLNLLQSKYESYFKEFVEDVEKTNTTLLVIYIPSYDYKNHNRLNKSRSFYSSLTGKYDVNFIDMTPIFLNYSPEVVTLLPEDGHLSRFGNILVADEIAKFIQKNNNFRTNISYSDRPKILGGLKPGDNSIWTIMPSMPFRVISNKQGLRMEYDLSFPKTKKRILAIGDSFTFGIYMDNINTFPALLGKKFKDIEVINGGVSSYTIADELYLYQENAKYVEPDLVILQVLDNDLFDLFYLKRIASGQRIKEYEIIPSELEKNFTIYVNSYAD